MSSDIDWGSLSHELNNAVQALALVAELILEDPTPARLAALPGAVALVSAAQGAIRDAARGEELDV